jgi:hypothetical protein
MNMNMKADKQKFHYSNLYVFTIHERLDRYRINITLLSPKYLEEGVVPNKCFMVLIKCFSPTKDTLLPVLHQQPPLLCIL